MSIILDALRKSEADRQRQSTPGIADVAEASDHSSTPRWIWGVGALLLVNLIVLAVILLRPSPEPASTPSVVLESPPVQETVEPVVQASLPAEEPAPAPSRPAETTSAPDPEPIASDPPPTREPVSQPAQSQPPTPAVSEPSTRTKAYSTLNELRAAGTVNLPDLHLDIHVYSERSAERFVFVNMSKYQENTALNEGPYVREIVPEGVILEYRGSEFLLPRQ